jgi:ribonuclease BN (tRNA processing enzyme)
MRIQFCGVRGSSPAPGVEFVRYGGHTACLALWNDGAPLPTLILDAGAGLQAAARLFAGEPFDGTILLTHLHWDHVLGLPFFAAADDVDARVSVLLPEQTELRGEWEFATVAPEEWQVEGFTVLAREVPHKGGRTFGYRIGDGHSTLAYIPDHCPTMLGPGEDGFGEYHPAALELARDADVLVHDALLFPAELAAEADFGHAVADYAVELARRAGARSVFLFHHRHDRTDEALDGLAQRLGGGSYPAVNVAAEGTVLEL